MVSRLKKKCFIGRQFQAGFLSLGRNFQIPSWVIRFYFKSDLKSLPRTLRDEFKCRADPEIRNWRRERGWTIGQVSQDLGNPKITLFRGFWNVS